MQIELTRLYRVKAVAEMCDVSVLTVYRAIKSGKLTAVRFGAGQGAVRVSGDALTAWIADCTVGAVLSAAQADGLACVLCGLDFLASKAAHYPVGRSHAGSQVFVCSTHRDASTDDVTGEVA